MKPLENAFERGAWDSYGEVPEGWCTQARRLVRTPGRSLTMSVYVVEPGAGTRSGRCTCSRTRSATGTAKRHHEATFDVVRLSAYLSAAMMLPNVTNRKARTPGGR
jgi:hypothetical protein